MRPWGAVGLRSGGAGGNGWMGRAPPSVPALSPSQQPWGHVSNGARAHGGGFPASGCREAFGKAGMRSRGAAMKPKTALPGPWVSTSGLVLAAAGGPRDCPIAAAAAPLLLHCPTSPGRTLCLGVRGASWLATSQCNMRVGVCSPWCSVHLSVQSHGCCAPWRVHSLVQNAAASSNQCTSENAVPYAMCISVCNPWRSAHLGARNSLCDVHPSACNPCCSAHLGACNSLRGVHLRVRKPLGSVHVGVQRPVQLHLGAGDLRVLRPLLCAPAQRGVHPNSATQQHGRALQHIGLSFSFWKRCTGRTTWSRTKQRGEAAGGFRCSLGCLQGWVWSGGTRHRELCPHWSPHRGTSRAGSIVPRTLRTTGPGTAWMR